MYAGDTANIYAVINGKMHTIRLQKTGKCNGANLVRTIDPWTIDDAVPAYEVETHSVPPLDADTAAGTDPLKNKSGR